MQEGDERLSHGFKILIGKEERVNRDRFCTRWPNVPGQRTHLPKLLLMKFYRMFAGLQHNCSQFIEYCEKWSAGKGWGRAHKKGLSRWYHSFDGQELKLARLVTRFPGKFRWCHKDVIRLAHIKPKNDRVGLILRYITHGLDEATKMYCSRSGQLDLDPVVVQIAEFLKAVEESKTCTEPLKIVQYVQKYKLAREHLPQRSLDNPDVLHALLNNMPLETMLRNLGKMAAVGLLSPGSITETLVVSKLESQENIRMSKLHPFHVLCLKCRYQKGYSVRGKLKWNWNENVKKALDKTFHLSFCNVVPTGKRLFVTYDAFGMCELVSGNSSVIARDAAATMIMAAVRTETDPQIYSFSQDIKKMEVSKQETIREVANVFGHLYYSATDCTRPITYALEHKIVVDVFIIYTDVNANFGNIHPVEALDRYRRFFEVQDTKLIIVGMSCNKPRFSFSFARRSDPFMLDIVGFDKFTPLAIDMFIRGNIL
ncbi:hypothetical protein KUTeg_022643 [Tegillarca granosa]|uniref:TROVE domain-containing protein n=1 Tax=Tegillarca granosa TaxID=220873 RepID=A0ABQ9DZ93_TEGGR|nr:hypothetical protein KUTeg_022643 [Tegillarca granosa]